MISLNVTRDAGGKISGFVMKGHADSGPHGSDIVCAGASAVSFGALNAIEQLTSVVPDVRQTPDGGWLSCRLPADDGTGNGDKARLILEAMLVSMQTIELSYSQYIHIYDKGGSSHVNA
jgi:Predicted ribosomal protein